MPSVTGSFDALCDADVGEGDSMGVVVRMLCNVVWEVENAMGSVDFLRHGLPWDTCS